MSNEYKDALLTMDSAKQDMYTEVAIYSYGNLICQKSM